MSSNSRDTCACANMYVCFPGKGLEKKNLIVMKTHITVSNQESKGNNDDSRAKKKN